MCLILYKDFTKIITHVDIVVYKVVTRVRTRTGQPDTFYKSPYFLFDYEKDVVYCGKLRKLVSPYSGDLVVEDGFHSYEHLKDAERNTCPCGIVVKCIIPAGSELYKGNGIDLTSQYASNKIIIKEEV